MFSNSTTTIRGTVDALKVRILESSRAKTVPPDPPNGLEMSVRLTHYPKYRVDKFSTKSDFSNVVPAVEAVPSSPFSGPNVQ